MQIALAVPVRDGRVLVAQRAPDDTFGGLWEFPGGKIEGDERPAEAARRELLEECGLIAGRLVALGEWSWEMPRRELRFHLFLAPDATGEVVTESGADHRWIEPDALDALEMPPVNARMFDVIRRTVASLTA